ncbi:hypothetical protein [uncultured Mediterranean phage uvDeep-CGR2-KM19-C184]|nr:hypothetical protein [uncultured Mediterranean phage uvDeep-CGR2-KM19-C184]
MYLQKTLTLSTMIKAFAVAVSGVLAGSAALAGPYVNVENNAGYSGGDYLGATTDFHVGFEGADGVYSYYAQGGPAFVSPQGEDGEFELSGKVGGNVQVAESVGIYGELSFITAEDDPSVGTKLGVKWAF